MVGLPPLLKLVPRRSLPTNITIYRYGMLILTFFAYMSYHISRKPLSIVKSELHRNCSNLSEKNLKIFLSLHHLSKEDLITKNDTWCDFPPFDQTNYKLLFGELDYAFLFTYAIGMYFSGMVAERMPIRYFISVGMLLSGLFTSMFGFGYFWSIHSFSFYVIAQVLNGIFQTTGWPSVVTVVGKWFGKQRRGLIMGFWNSHTSFGNILGSVIASAYVATNWGLSFVIPGIVIASLGVICFCTLIEKPEDLGVRYQQLRDEEDADASSRDESNDEGTSPNYDSIRQENWAGEVSNDPESNCNPSINHSPIGFCKALTIPGVAEYSLCLLFAKLVSYTFLFWLPFYIKNTSSMSAENAGLLSTLFDVGGIFGGIFAGFLSDNTGDKASTCGVMLLIGAGMMYLYNVYGSISLNISITILFITGAFVNGPYALITTAVSADLGMHRMLQNNAKALSTVTAIIDGTGSIGAALGPLFTGFILPTGWKNVFWMLIVSNLLAFLCLTRLIIKEICKWNATRSVVITFQKYCSQADPMTSPLPVADP